MLKLNIPTVVSGWFTSIDVCAIYDSTGTPTYYSTLQAAITAAGSGETVQILADITETGTTEITLKDGVNINGNGHTYTNSNAGSNDAVTDNNVAVTCKILNWTVVRTTGTGYALHIDNRSSEIDATGSTFKNSGATTVACEGTLMNCNGENTAGGTNVVFLGRVASSGYGTFINCTTISGTIGFKDFQECVDCRAYVSDICYLWSSIPTSDVYLTNCRGDSTGNHAIEIENIATNGSIYIEGGQYKSSANNCIVCAGRSLYITGGSYVSTGGVAAYFTSTAQVEATGTYFYSSTVYGVGSDASTDVLLVGCKVVSDASYGATCGSGGTIEFYNCLIKSNWNNSSGHAVFASSTSTNFIKGCVLETTHASANSIHATSSTTVTYVDNMYKGSPTTPINAKITQGSVGTEDNYGNILI